MSKSLKTVQVFFKVARVLALVLFIFSIIGAVGGLLGATMLFAFGRTSWDSALSNIVEVESLGSTYAVACFSCITAVIVCAGMAVVSKFAEVYFKNEIKVGTPFTYAGAKELLRLSIISMAVGIGTSLLIGLVMSICWVLEPDVTFSVEYSADLTTGLSMLLMSFVFKYGAEVREEKEQAQAQLAELSVPEEKPTEEEQTVEQ